MFREENRLSEKDYSNRFKALVFDSFCWVLKYCGWCLDVVYWRPSKYFSNTKVNRTIYFRKNKNYFPTGFNSRCYIISTDETVSYYISISPQKKFPTNSSSEEAAFCITMMDTAAASYLSSGSPNSEGFLESSLPYIASRYFSIWPCAHIRFSFR